MKEKCDFAKQCKITWDGITNAENDKWWIKILLILI